MTPHGNRGGVFLLVVCYVPRATGRLIRKSKAATGTIVSRSGLLLDAAFMAMPRRQYVVTAQDPTVATLSGTASMTSALLRTSKAIRA